MKYFVAVADSVSISEAAKRLIGSIEKPRTTLVERVVIEGILVAGKSVGRI